MCFEGESVVGNGNGETVALGSHDRNGRFPWELEPAPDFEQPSNFIATANLYFPRVVRRKTFGRDDLPQIPHHPLRRSEDNLQHINFSAFAVQLPQ